MSSPFFADADSSFDDAKYVLYGVPFDRTASFRAGARKAPPEIRRASYNFETYMPEHEADLTLIPVHDMGDTDEFGSTEEMVEEVSSISRNIAKKDKFPIAVGGEHSISPPALSGLASKLQGKLGVLVVDAHLDFRDEYLGDKHSHACTSRRFADIVGADKVLPIGVRSMSREELEDTEELGLRWLSAGDIMSGLRPEEAVSRAMGDGVERLYLSIDIDGIDPAHAPGVGNPEPFGLDAGWVKGLIQASAPYLEGLDVTEVCPPVDNGNTSALAARLIRETVAATWKHLNPRSP